MEASIKLYSLEYGDYKTYLKASLFVLGNMALPQLVHLMPQGGVIWLPIYFFTLIAACKYGWKTGLLTAVLSPLLNSLVFGMPMPEILPAILLKSVLLALVAGIAVKRCKKVTIFLLATAVLFSQLVGTWGEWLLLGDFSLAVQDFRMGLPGMLLQVFGGYAVMQYLLKK